MESNLPSELPGSFFLAVENGDLSKVRSLVRHPTIKLLILRDSYTILTLLELALENGHRQIAKILSKEGHKRGSFLCQSSLRLRVACLAARKGEMKVARIIQGRV